jgi:hypothetical protein
MDRRSQVILAVIILVVVGAALSAWFIYSQVLQLPMYVYEDIASDVSVAETWTELTPPKPMKQSRRFQAVSLRVAGARQKLKMPGFLLPDGTQVEPELQILDDEGTWHDLGGGGYGVAGYDSATGTFSMASAEYKLHEDAKMPFRKVRIRCETPFVIDKISGVNYNLK